MGNYKIQRSNMNIPEGMNSDSTNCLLANQNNLCDLMHIGSIRN